MVASTRRLPMPMDGFGWWFLKATGRAEFTWFPITPRQCHEPSQPASASRKCFNCGRGLWCTGTCSILKEKGFRMLLSVRTRVNAFRGVSPLPMLWVSTRCLRVPPENTWLNCWIKDDCLRLRALARALPDVYVSQTVSVPKMAPVQQVLEFRPVDSVRVTAHCNSSDGAPVTGSQLFLHGGINRRSWSAKFHDVSDTPGKYVIRAPRGLEFPRIFGSGGFFASHEYDAGQLYFLRVTRRSVGAVDRTAIHPSTLNDDDDSWQIQRLKAASVTIRPLLNGQPYLSGRIAPWPMFANDRDAQELGAGSATASGLQIGDGGRFQISVHPNIDLCVKIEGPGINACVENFRLNEGEQRVIEIDLEPAEGGLKSDQGKTSNDRKATREKSKPSSTDLTAITPRSTQPPVENIRVAEKYLPDQPWAARSQYMMRAGQQFIYTNEWFRQSNSKSRLSPFAMVVLQKNLDGREQALTFACDTALVQFAEETNGQNQPGRVASLVLDGNVRVKGTTGNSITGNEFKFDETGTLVADAKTVGSATPLATGKNVVAVDSNGEEPLEQLINQAIQSMERRRLILGAHSPWQVMQWFKAFGRESMAKKSADSGERIPIWDWISSGPESRREPVWQIRDGVAQAHPFTRSFDVENSVGQFVAWLGAAGVPIDAQLTALDEEFVPDKITIRRLVHDLRRVKPVRNDDRQWLLWALVQYSEPEQIWNVNQPKSQFISTLIRNQAESIDTYANHNNAVGLLGLWRSLITSSRPWAETIRRRPWNFLLASASDSTQPSTRPGFLNGRADGWNPVQNCRTGGTKTPGCSVGDSNWHGSVGQSPRNDLLRKRGCIVALEAWHEN